MWLTHEVYTQTDTPGIIITHFIIIIAIIVTCTMSWRSKNQDKCVYKHWWYANLICCFLLFYEMDICVIIWGMHSMFTCIYVCMGAASTESEKNICCCMQNPVICTYIYVYMQFFPSIFPSLRAALYFLGWINLPFYNRTQSKWNLLQKFIKIKDSDMQNWCY